MLTNNAVHLKDVPSQTSFVTGTGARFVYNMPAMNSTDTNRKHRNTYEAFIGNRPCSDELRGSSSDRKQSNSELHDEQWFRNLTQKGQERAGHSAYTTPLFITKPDCRRINKYEDSKNVL